VRQRLGLALDQPVQVLRRLEFHGNRDYGGWSICPDGIDARSIVYDVGVGEDLSFAASLAATYRLHIWAFDPTPRSIQWFGLEPRSPLVHFNAYGIADFNGEATFYLPYRPGFVSGSLVARGKIQGEAIKVRVKRLANAMRELGHSKVDILKLDIEGAEYAVLDDLLQCRLQVDQILVEFHAANERKGFLKAREAIGQLNDQGYRIFATKHGTDFSFIRK